KGERVFKRAKVVKSFPTRQVLESRSLGSQTCRNSKRWQSGELSKGADTPGGQSIGHLGRTRKQVQGQRCQNLCFIAGPDHRDTAKATRGKDRAIGIAGDCYIDR